MNTILQEQTGRIGDWMQTYSGVAFFPFDPRPEEVFIEDIAHSLSLQCRYGGHCLRFYSVAEHSIYVSRLCSLENKLWGLLHDASEAYVLDMIRPLKWHFPDFKNLENNILFVIAEKFGLGWPVPAEVIQIDNALLAAERDQIMASPPFDWQVDYPAPDIIIHGLEPQGMEKAFLRRFKELSK